MKRSFTLLELIVVIAVIGILLTLLVPSLRKSKEVAQKAVCASNYQQMYIGCMLLTKKNNLKLPRTRRGQWNHYSWIWEVSLALNLDADPNPSVANNELFTCPKVPVNQAMNTSYTYNIYCGSKKNGWARYDIVKLAKVSRPEEAWYIGEGVPPQFNTGLFNNVSQNEEKLHNLRAQGILLNGAVKSVNPHQADAILNPDDPASKYWASWANQTGK